MKQQEPFSWGLSGIAPDRARPPFLGVPQSPAVHAAGRFHWGRKCRALFLLRQLKRLLVVFKGMFSFDFFVQAVVFPFVSFENTFRSLGRFLPVFCLYVYLLAAAFLWEWSGLAPESFIFSFDCSSFELSFHEPDHPVSRAGRHGDSAYAVVSAAKGLPSWHHGQKQRVWVESWFVLALFES